MPKAGKYEYPAYDLDTCVERLRKIYETSKTDIIKRETAADIIDMSPKSGATLSFFASLAMYGLVEHRNGNIEITDLAKRIMFGSSDEVAISKRDAVKNIQLFADLFNQYGVNVTEEQLRVFLREKAVVDLAKIPELIWEISKIYRKVAPYLIVAEQPRAVAPQLPAEAAEKEATPAVPEVSEAKVLKIRYGDIDIVIPADHLDDLEAISLAKQALNYIEKKILEKKKQIEEQKTT